MKSRHSRFKRLYRRLTRGAPDRKNQLIHINLNRAAVSSFAGMTDRRRRFPVTINRQWDELRGAEAAATEPPVPTTQEPDAVGKNNDRQYRPISEALHENATQVIGIVVWSLAGSLLLLAGAYAGLSGYMHSSNVIAPLGVMGAVVAILAAGLGVFMTTSVTHRSYSAPFLSVAVVFLTGLYGALFFLAIAG